MERTAQCDVHADTDRVDVLQTPGCGASRMQPTNSNEHRWPSPHSTCTEGTSSTGKRSATTLDSPCGSTSCPGPSKREWSDYSPDCVPQRDTTRTSGSTSTRHSTVKMAAVAYAHKRARNVKLDYRDPEFELIAQGYKRTNSQVDRKQPVTTPMLHQVRRCVDTTTNDGRLLWGSIILGFFFLDRSSELWGPVTVDKSTGSERAHCVKASNVIIRNIHGNQVPPDAPGAHSVEIVYESHKGDRIGQGVTVRHYRSDDPVLCPVAAAQECLGVRAQWLQEGKALGPYLTSTAKTSTIKTSAVAAVIKDAAHSMGHKKKDYSSHSLRIGGACALLAAGKSDLVIRLMGRWSSWCFQVYTRLRPGMVRDAASSMIKASTWECHEPRLEPSEGVSREAITIR